MDDDPVGEIVDRLIDDLRGRSGFDGLWDELDPDIQEEIREEWRSIVMVLWYYHESVVAQILNGAELSHEDIGRMLS